ncbi:hypothetical protein DFP73DRAFT_524744 [Morchella snyderi]|nr:hypothetical protein DFP73DRAFT_524744 [Morchella snyderi]
MFSRPPSSDSDNPSPHRPPAGDPRSPRSCRRVFYTFSPLAQPLAASIERLESAPLVSQEQIGALGSSLPEMSASRQSFVDARNAMRSPSPDGREDVISWLDDQSASSQHSLPVISPSGSSRSSGVVSLYSTGDDEDSVYNASVISEDEMERMQEQERIVANRDWEMLQEIPVPVAHAQLIWMMRLDEYDDEMVLQGMRGCACWRWERTRPRNAISPTPGPPSLIRTSKTTNIHTARQLQLHSPITQYPKLSNIPVLLLLHIITTHPPLTALPMPPTPPTANGLTPATPANTNTNTHPSHHLYATLHATLRTLPPAPTPLLHAPPPRFHRRRRYITLDEDFHPARANATPCPHTYPSNRNHTAPPQPQANMTATTQQQQQRAAETQGAETEDEGTGRAGMFRYGRAPYVRGRARRGERGAVGAGGDGEVLVAQEGRRGSRGAGEEEGRVSGGAEEEEGRVSGGAEEEEEEVEEEEGFEAWCRAHGLFGGEEGEGGEGGGD